MSTTYTCRLYIGDGIMTEEEFAKYKEIFNPDAELRELRENEKPRTDGKVNIAYGSRTFAADPAHFKQVFPNIDITIGSEIPANHAYEISKSLSNIENTLDAFRDAVDKMLSNKGSPGIPNKSKYQNLTVAKAAVPESYFILINEIVYEEDACTDYIQSMINVGWRILAICPQPGQRRPDYIMGRISQR